MKVPFDLRTELLQGEMKDFFLSVPTGDAKHSPALRNYGGQMLSLHAIASVAAGAAHYIPASD